MNEYIIKHGQYYIMEGTTCPHRVLDINQATTFGSLDTLTTYVQKSMSTNLAHVTVIKREVVETQLILSNGSWVDFDTVEQCNHCYKWYPKSELKYGRHGDSDIELLCEVDRELLDVVIINEEVA